MSQEDKRITIYSCALRKSGSCGYKGDDIPTGGRVGNISGTYLCNQSPSTMPGKMKCNHLVPIETTSKVIPPTT